MDKLEKLALLGESAKYDVCASSSAPAKKIQKRRHRPDYTQRSLPFFYT